MFLLLWAIVRPFYLFGLFFVSIFFLVVLANGVSTDPDFAVPSIAFCFLYFFVGYIWFRHIPRRYESRLMARLNANRGPGFKPLAQATEFMWHRAIALDPNNRKLLYIDMHSKTEELLDYNDIRAWELSPSGSETTSLTLATDSPTNPTIGIKVPANQLNNFSVWLRAIH